MKTFRLECGNCKTVLSVPLNESLLRSGCPACQADIYAEVFPALFRDISTGDSGETLLAEGESSCFHHPTKKAVVPCEGCGRFLCSLCDIEFDGRHLCPTCIEKGVEKRKIKKLQTQVTRFDDIALSLAIVPLIFFCLTLFTAPASIFVAIRYWNAPATVTPRGKWRFVVAIVLAGFQVLGWGLAGTRLLGRILFK